MWKNKFFINREKNSQEERKKFEHHKNLKKTIKIWVIWSWVLLWILWIDSLSKNDNQTEKIEENKTILKITEKTNWKVKNILKISDVCENWEIILEKPKINWNEIILEYDCEKKLKLNWVNSLPPIPWIPTGAPLPF